MAELQNMIHIIKLFPIILISISAEDIDRPKKIEDLNYISLLILSPQYVLNQKNWRVCTAILLVEDLFYLTAESCFDEVEHDRKVKIALTRETKPNFNFLVYEDFIMNSRDLQKFIVLRKDGIELLVEKYPKKKIRKSVSKDPFEIDNLSEPRVLLTFPWNQVFTHCYCLGWGSFMKQSVNLLNSTLEFSSSKIFSTELKDGGEILVEWEENEKSVEDLGSPILCETKKDNAILAAAVVGIFIGDNTTEDMLKNGFTKYRSFIDTLEPLTRWAIGTNVSVTGNLEDWTLWPANSALEEPVSEGLVRAGVSSVILSELNYIKKIICFVHCLLLLYTNYNFEKYHILFLLVMIILHENWVDGNTYRLSL